MVFLISITLFFLLVRLFITVLNFINKPLLPLTNIVSKDLISILVPSRNEAINLPKLFESLEKQTFSNYELIILDDESDDNTSGVVKNYSLKNPRCRLFNSKPLPEGWLGKNWACHQLSQVAKGNYFIFLDADVVLNENFFESILAEIKDKKLSLLSVFPDQIMLSKGEKIVVPLMHYVLLSLLSLNWVYKFKYSSLSAANGQCMAFNALDYNRNLFHSQVKDYVTEDIRIMHLVKKQKLKGAVYLGNNLIKCRMYKNLNESINGFSKNFISSFGNKIFPALVYVFSVSLFYLPLIITDYRFKVEILFLALTIILFIKAMISKMSNQNIFENIIYHPLQIAALTFILFKSIYLKLTGTNRWKGRAI